MTKKEERRIASFLPGGIPKWVRIYDDGGKSADRYTVVFTGKGYKCEGYPGRFHTVIGMSGAPFHPQGICQHEEWNQMFDAPQGWPVAIGRRCYLGKRIPFKELPLDCQKVVMNDYCEVHELPKTFE